MNKTTGLIGCGYPYSHSGCLPMGPSSYNTQHKQNVSMYIDALDYIVLSLCPYLDARSLSNWLFKEYVILIIHVLSIDLKVPNRTTACGLKHIANVTRGGAGVNHVKRDWPEIFNVNCDLYIFFYVKRDRGYLRETWSVIYIQREPWLRHLFLRENGTNPPKFAYLNDILLMHDT